MSLSLAEKMDRLASLRFFRDFEPDALRLLAFSAAERRFRVGDVLLRAEQAVYSALVLLSGAAERDKARVPAGGLIGLRAMLARGRASADVTATAEGVALEVSHELIWRVLREFPASAVAARDAQAEEARHFIAAAGSLRRHYEAETLKA